MKVDFDNGFLLFVCARMLQVNEQDLDLETISGEVITQSIGDYFAACARGEVRMGECYLVGGEMATFLDVTSMEPADKIRPGTQIYELVHLTDGSSRIYPMTVKTITQYGAVRQKNGKAMVWNIYAESPYTKGYYSFYDLGSSIFIDPDEAMQKLSGDIINRK